MQANLVNGWREVLARIFDGFEVEYGVSPEWLVNPDTNRRLKLDYLFPDIAVAVRFVGLTGSGQRQRKSRFEATCGGDCVLGSISARSHAVAGQRCHTVHVPSGTVALVCQRW